jgi:hypothetical protein
MPNPLRILAVLLFASTLALPATSLTIDNFEEGDFVVVDTTVPAGPTQGEQSGMAPHNTAGGVRLVRSLAAGGVTGTSTLVTTGGDDGALMTVTGSPAGLTDFTYIYDGIANGLSDGNAGTLNLNLTGAPSIDVQVSLPLPIGAGFLRVTMWDSTINRSSGFQQITNGGNSILIDGTLLDLDLTDINAILIAVTDLNPGETVNMLHISTVPEPGTALLMAVGLLGMAIRRARSR